MSKIVWRNGLIAGAIIAAVMAITIPLCMSGRMDYSNSAVIGFSAMFLAFTGIFFAIRTYRDTAAGGTISFGKAFQVGILTALVACGVYVVGWQIVFWNFLPDFGDKYAAYQLDKIRKSGATPAEIAEEEKKMAEFTVSYRNPVYNVGVTFMEIFPVGLIVTLVSAAILRRKRDEPVPAAA